MKNILLINPNYINETWLTDGDDPDSEAIHDLVPLGLATVAGLTPPGIEVVIWDEPVRGLIGPDTKFDRDYDLVGVTSWTVNLPRCRELGEMFRRRGIPVVIGGPGVSGRPDMWREHFDVLFVGEVEETWPQFLRDFDSGNHRSVYRQIQKPELDSSPPPRWDSVAGDMRRYVLGAVQTTRGCPFDCEFCDVIYLFGRRQRHKRIDRVLEEVAALERLGVSRIFFSDDEFIGDPRYAKELLRALIPLNKSFATPLNYSTQLTMNLSRDDELLRLIADANFSSAIVGVETPNKASLKETNKHQNVRKDLVADVRKILSYGIEIIAGMIVGFDHDGPDIFDTQYEFIQQSYIPSISLNMLKAAIGTRLWTRLRQEGRVLDITRTLGKRHSRGTTNIVPKGMTRVELMHGFRNLFQRLHTWESFGERMRGWVSIAHRGPIIGHTPVTVEDLKSLPSVLGIEGHGARVIDELAGYTQSQAPYMMSLMKRMIIKHCKIKRMVSEIVATTDEQIELESTGRLRYDTDNRPITIPPAFASAYRHLFPKVHRRVYINLKEKKMIPEALTEVFFDFLVRWGEGFEKLEDCHEGYLTEICDRTCAKFNGQPPQEFVPVTLDSIPVPDVKRSRLGDDILKNVGQELLTLMTSGPSQRADTMVNLKVAR